MFRLTFPQPGMLKTEDLDRMMSILSTQNVSRAGIQDIAERMRAGMNPHPANQKKENVPRMNGKRVDGIQHKYKETVLFFPSEVGAFSKAIHPFRYWTRHLLLHRVNGVTHTVLIASVGLNLLPLDQSSNSSLEVLNSYTTTSLLTHGSRIYCSLVAIQWS